jgi:hypothetical protein
MALPLVFTLDGFAAGLTANRTVAEPWKERVASTARAGWSGAYLSEPVGLEIGFLLPPERYRTTAVFNLLKSTIDGLSAAVFAASAGGQPGPWSREDWWITTLVATKAFADLPSVEIRLDRSENFPDFAGAPLSSGWVPGDPPPWPGDAAGQRRVLAWRAALAASLPKPTEPPESIGVSFEFVVRKGEMQRTDLDNLCVPACQAVGLLVFGDLRHPNAIASIRATKRQASDPTSVGTKVEVRALPAADVP